MGIETYIVISTIQTVILLIGMYVKSFITEGGKLAAQAKQKQPSPSENPINHSKNKELGLSLLGYISENLV